MDLTEHIKICSEHPFLKGIHSQKQFQFQYCNVDLLCNHHVACDLLHYVNIYFIRKYTSKTRIHYV